MSFYVSVSVSTVHYRQKKSAFKGICMTIKFTNPNNTVTSKSQETCSLIHSQTAINNNNTVILALVSSRNQSLA